jgi:hypothetical protein
MNDLRADQLATLCDIWWQMIANLLSCQWNIFTGYYQSSLNFMEGMLAPRKEASVAPRHEDRSLAVEEFRKILYQATERVRQGLGPVDVPEFKVERLELV